VSAATQVYYASFDAVFLKLPPPLRARVEAKIDEIGSQLGSFPHHRLKGSNRFRARVGDYRIIYAFDVGQNRIHLLAIGHRREIYRSSAALGMP
jgi:mRNA interferase RelE/StbE